MNEVKCSLAAALSLAACAMPTHVEVPRAIEVSSNEVLARVVRAKGVQIYECRAKPGAQPEWAFVAPDAELYDVRGHPVGHHGAGPVWQAKDGSTIRGSVKARADAPSAGAIPWLLLATKPAGPDGIFSQVSSIQRVNTVGGVAPENGCNRETIGTPARVAYTADYLFFSAR